MINISGNKVDPVEIENILTSHPDIHEAAVIGIMGQHNAETVKAFIVCDEYIERKDIIQYLKNQVSDYKIPKIIDFVQSIPKSPTGKILRNKLK